MHEVGAIRPWPNAVHNPLGGNNHIWLMHRPHYDGSRNELQPEWVVAVCDMLQWAMQLLLRWSFWATKSLLFYCPRWLVHSIAIHPTKNCPLLSTSLCLGIFTWNLWCDLFKWEYILNDVEAELNKIINISVITVLFNVSTLALCILGSISGLV